MEVALASSSPWTPVDVELSLPMEGGATQHIPSTTYYLIITLQKPSRSTVHSHSHLGRTLQGRGDQLSGEHHHRPDGPAGSGGSSL